MVSNDDIYWISKNGLWKIGKWKTDRGMQWYIEDTAIGYNDNPIVYDDGRVAFDEPYAIPKYVKNQFKILVNRERRVEASPNRSNVPKDLTIVSNSEISPAMKEIKDDLIFESMLNEKKKINILLHQPFFKIEITEEMGNPKVEKIVREMIDIANEDFISKVDSGVTDLLLELDDEIPLIYKTMREIMLEKYR